MLNRLVRLVRGDGVRPRVAAALLWLWVVVAFLAYLAQFRAIARDILAMVVGS